MVVKSAWGNLTLQDKADIFRNQGERYLYTNISSIGKCQLCEQAICLRNWYYRFNNRMAHVDCAINTSKFILKDEPETNSYKGISTAEAAKLHNCSESTIRRQLRLGTLSGIKIKLANGSEWKIFPNGIPLDYQDLFKDNTIILINRAVKPMPKNPTSHPACICPECKDPVLKSHVASIAPKPEIITLEIDADLARTYRNYAGSGIILNVLGGKVQSITNYQSPIQTTRILETIPTKPHNLTFVQWLKEIWRNS